MILLGIQTQSAEVRVEQVAAVDFPVNHRGAVGVGFADGGAAMGPGNAARDTVASATPTTPAAPTPATPAPAPGGDDRSTSC